jgi:hypothetical protein
VDLHRPVVRSREQVGATRQRGEDATIREPHDRRDRRAIRIRDRQRERAGVAHEQITGSRLRAVFAPRHLRVERASWRHEPRVCTVRDGEAAGPARRRAPRRSTSRRTCRPPRSLREPGRRHLVARADSDGTREPHPSSEVLDQPTPSEHGVGAVLALERRADGDRAGQRERPEPSTRRSPVSGCRAQSVGHLSRASVGEATLDRERIAPGHEPIDRREPTAIDLRINSRTVSGPPTGAASITVPPPRASCVSDVGDARTKKRAIAFSST